MLARGMEKMERKHEVVWKNISREKKKKGKFIHTTQHPTQKFQGFLPRQTRVHEQERILPANRFEIFAFSTSTHVVIGFIQQLLFIFCLILKIFLSANHVEGALQLIALLKLPNYLYNRKCIVLFYDVKTSFLSRCQTGKDFSIRSRAHNEASICMAAHPIS